MKIFETGEKINFVDENNVLVGYDLYQQCCESAGWFISNSKNETKVPENFDDDCKNWSDILQDYFFDKNYFYDQFDQDVEYDWTDYAQFRLISKDEKRADFYLYLYNWHNGYYVHDFNMEIGNEIFRKGSL